MRELDRAEPLRRLHLVELLAGIEPWDAAERADIVGTAEWVADGAPLYRVRKPDVPAKHLVSYFVVFDEGRRELLLVAHRKAGLWLPSGGHVEPDEDPWETVVRECREELGVPAVPSTFAGERPFFLTVTETRGAGRHTDVSLWYVLRGDPAEIVAYDEEEFDAIRWVAPADLLAEPAETLDPQLHRFTRKLLAALA
ncbi:NUDIX domain-containing protein [Micromonospora sp. NPDC049559]|uniref:NUDIX hydrolase n=1 Tax=Micromonospora sp. NPDC049559 TaxID=3155923 RepID=UPI003445D823